IPDTYAVTASKEGYETVTLTGVEVVADNTRTVFVQLKPVKTLGAVVVSRSGLVSAGTTVDVYSMNRPVQRTLVGINGGYDINNSYSAIAAVPGAFVPPIASGWNQPVFIRGGAFDQVGYEYDGIPVNRAYDNAPLTTLSNVGQQLVQVYTGGAPADAESRGLAGYINQVVRTGSYPGFTDVTLGIGSPALYNKFDFETGGAAPNHRFSYFVAIGGYDQAFRYIDQSNGAAFSVDFGQPFDLKNVVLGPIAGGTPGCGLPNGSNFTGCYANTGFFESLPAGPGGYVIGPYPMGRNSGITDRDNIANFHFAIPRSGNNTPDDVQLLYDLSQMYTYSYSSYNNWGGSAFWNGYNTTPGFHSGQVPVFVPGFQYTGALLQPISGTLGGPITGVIPYFFPSAGRYGGGAQIPVNQQDAQSNGLAITKLQYTHFFSPEAYLRVYGFTTYSNWFTYSPNGQSQFYISMPADREFSEHQRGVSAEYYGQLGVHNLFEVQGSYTYSNDYAVENDQPSTSVQGPPWFPAPQTAFAALVSAANPTNGTCYFLSFPLPPPSIPGPPTATSCEPITPLPGPTSGFLNQKFLTFAGPFFPAPPGGCGGVSACEWLALENGQTGPINGVTPKFSALSLQDQWTPSARLHMSIGVRWDRYVFDIPPTAGGPARAFWFNAWNNVMCFFPGFNGGNPIDETLLGAPPGTPCNTIPVPPGGGPNFAQATLTNSTANGATTSFDEVQPRIGGTYTFNPFDVVRFSYGIYAQPPPTQFQYTDTLQQNLPAFIGPLYFALGDSTPLHPVRPQVSYDVDLSYEHRFNDADTSLKLTPFSRVTRDQIQRFFINPVTGTLGGVNAGKQNSSGFEFQLQKGDFTHNGLSVLLSYTYTYSYITYSPLPNGANLLSGVNASIQQYNSFTSACAAALPSASPSAPCGVFGGANAIATELSGVANPYFNAPLRPLFNPSAPYPTYYVVPTGTQLSTASIGVPSFLAMTLSYKHDRFTIAPLFQYVEGSKYGAPQQQIGVDPTTCAPLAAAPPVASDPRYPFGGSGTGYDATTCTGTLVIPDQFTGNFDAPGAFREPNLFALHAQIGYEMSSAANLRLTLTNLYTRCSGGTALPWNTNSGSTCGYDFLQGHIPPAGNIFNPGDPIQPIVRFPYGAALSAQPFNAYLDVEFKL
ncbi:MAG TPA: TonB-dependent receptor, partial [Candidatus Binatus sp.]|nr:TonB-dependent receptor [Candidatus Binatus sp.]